MTAIALADLQTEIAAGWAIRESLTPATAGPLRTAVDEVLRGLDAGELRVAEKVDGAWITRQWLKQAILLSFRLNPNRLMRAGTFGDAVGPWWDKVPGKFDGWEAVQFESAGFRAVPGAVVRRGAFIGRNAVLMPSFVNIGAYVGEGTMIDTWATVGSCAQIGAGVHISGGAGIGGVLEPLQAAPTIIEDGCFIGARSEVAEGVIVGEGAVLSMGVFITATTRIVDRKTGEIHRGSVPPYAVVAPGFMPDPHGIGPGLSCAVIVKTVDAQTRSKTSINELLRE
ncbi:MAG TPA: 2,3,4,5-tetrahydropyridine-2,6-dicarboxylate N-succinyltransferase [Caulobacteraceae bacterium]|jgi:2,3,4,5-tetrahydropyridine-2-carboxylate N-succinyltransferase|nr:2,3,4,5-tetrahydropyridine-2,6-dicarboxylate N-succinyltransferase [Caulobacteraceae bacterium]